MWRSPLILTVGKGLSGPLQPARPLLQGNHLGGGVAGGEEGSGGGGGGGNSGK